ncbi:MAG: hypothetical protein JXR18_02105 [Neptuniibacter sp.]
MPKAGIPITQASEFFLQIYNGIGDVRQGCDMKKEYVGFIFSFVILNIAFVMFNYKEPEGNIVVGNYVFSHISDSTGKYINTRRPTVAVFYDRDRMVKVSDGYAVKYARNNLTEGEVVKVFWLNPCHEAVVMFKGLCFDDLAVGSMDIPMAIQHYKEKIEKLYLVVFSIDMFLLVILCVAFLERGALMLKKR